MNLNNFQQDYKGGIYMNWIDMTVVTFCGIALLMTVWLGNTDLAGTIAVGLLGYLGGKASDVVK